MTYVEVVNQIKQMSRAEQQAILRELQSALKTAPRKAKRKATLKSLYNFLQVDKFADPNETPEQRAIRLASLPTAEEMTGVIPSDGHVPTDEEVKEDYINHLAEKYK